eukprot:TRINITY_DN2208_c0_g1_i6.p1 TRINITY_DN2208_c0_g1~~TRINITY_DN2208_c0_g1_i6.p1  ORF type:complete len:198 (-),score=60.00 TRINITY_DN2208_c0_g1_i6:100-693(-)
MLATATVALNLPASLRLPASVSSPIEIAKNHKKGTLKHKLQLKCSAFEGAIQIPLQLSYLIETNGEKERCRVSGTVAVPVSAFMRPVAISDQEYREILADPAHQCNQLVSAKLRLAQGSLDQAIATTKRIAGVHLVDLVEQGAMSVCMLYGRSILNQHVCLLLKWQKQTREISIDIKSSVLVLAQHLLRDLQWELTQ